MADRGRRVPVSCESLVRRRLFGRRHPRRDRDRAELVGEFLWDEPSAGLGPVLRGELEVAVARPERHDADHLGQVSFGVESVESARGDEGEEIGGGGGVVVGAEEEPCIATDRDRSEGALAVIVGHDQAAIVEESAERAALPNDVAERGSDEAAHALEALELEFGPGEEVLDERPQSELTQLVPLARRELRPLLFEFEEHVEAKHGLARARVLGNRRRFKEASSRVGPTPDFLGHLVGGFASSLAAKNGIVDGVGIGLNVASESLEHPADGGARVLGLEWVQIFCGGEKLRNCVGLVEFS